MDKSQLHALPDPQAGYIGQIENEPLNAAFARSLARLQAMVRAPLKAYGPQVYAPGKWTLHDIFQHLSDCERIFAYRALRIARNDPTPLAGFDQEPYGRYAHASDRDLDDLIDELLEVHQSSAHLFNSFDDEMLLRSGECAGHSFSVLAIGYLILGHQAHHLRIIAEKYGLPV